MSGPEFCSKLVIVGAGPAGCATAIESAGLGRECLLLDRAEFPRDKICGDALSGKVVDSLNKLGLQPHERFKMLPDALPSWGIEFFAPSGEKLRVPFRREIDPIKDKPPGFIMPRLKFDQWLLDEALQKKNVEFRPNHEVKSVHRETNGRIRLQFAKGNDLICSQLVAADGVHSPTRKLINDKPWPKRHHCAGVRAYFDGVEGLDETGFIELHFLKDLLPGYFWIFPLAGGRANVGLGMRSDIVRKKKLNLRQMLSSIIQNNPVLKTRFSRAKQTSPTTGMGLPLGSKFQKLHGEGILRVGDAASLIDPFTGEGIGNALLSGRIAAQQIQKALEEPVKHHLEHFDVRIQEKMRQEFQVSSLLQRLTQMPWLFNKVVSKANRNTELQDALICMFEDVDLRKTFTRPSFYFNLMFR